MVKTLRIKFLQHIMNDKIRSTGWFLFIIGLIIFFTNYTPPVGYDKPGDWVKWSFLQLAGTIGVFVGLAGIFHKRVDSQCLRLLDFIWISGSAIGVALAFVLFIHNEAVGQREFLQRNIDSSVVTAKRFLPYAYNKYCNQGKGLTENFCNGLKTLAVTLENNPVYLSEVHVDSICPKTINLTSPPEHFSFELIELCINARYIANELQDPIFEEQNNFNDLYLFPFIKLWPLFLFSLISIRFVKSVAEVFWNKP